jgi:hypothetical protein
MGNIVFDAGAMGPLRAATTNSPEIFSRSGPTDLAIGGDNGRLLATKAIVEIGGCARPRVVKRFERQPDEWFLHPLRARLYVPNDNPR